MEQQRAPTECAAAASYCMKANTGGVRREQKKRGSSTKEPARLPAGASRTGETPSNNILPRQNLRRSGAAATRALEPEGQAPMQGGMVPTKRFSIVRVLNVMSPAPWKQSATPPKKPMRHLSID